MATFARVAAAALALSVALLIWELRSSSAGLILLALAGGATAFVVAERALVLALVLLGFVD